MREQKDRNASKNEQKEKKNRFSARWVAAGMIAVCLLSAALLWLLLQRYERGILDICAAQQDAYVQLVVDQIHLKENRSDEEIITDILGTMDSSADKYWTFSSDQAMLFVKDVAETNKYKGFTTATYYASDSAKEFLDSLKPGQVTHADIKMDDKTYIASGCSFEYGEQTYRLCLLTNRSVLLDNNRFLGAKTELVTLVAVLLLLLMLIPLLLSQRIEKLQKKLEETAKEAAVLSRGLTKMNQRLSERELYDTRDRVWSGSLLEDFIERLKERNAAPLVLITMKCADERTKRKLLKRASVLLDRTVLRFAMGKNDIAFLFVQCSAHNAILAARELKMQKVILDRVFLLKKGDSKFKELKRKAAGKE